MTYQDNNGIPLSLVDHLIRDRENAYAALEEYRKANRAISADIEALMHHPAPTKASNVIPFPTRRRP